MTDFLLNVIIFSGAMFFFLSFFGKMRCAVYGAILYITLPYTVFLMYDIEEPERGILWALIPWALFFVTIIIRPEIYKNKSVARLIGALGIALIIIFVCVYYREYIAFVLYGGADGESFGADNPIGNDGYYFADFFTRFAYINKRPGMGIGLEAGLTLFIYYLLTDGKSIGRIYKLVSVIALIFMFLSFRYIPYDRIESINGVTYRIVRLMEYPNVMFSKGCALLTIPAVYSLVRFEKEKKESVWGFIPGLSLGLSIFMALYLRFQL